MSTAQAHVFDADDYPAAVTREVRGLGECRVDGLMMDEAMRLFAVDRPHRLDYQHWTSDFIATSLAEPRLSLREVEELSDLAREALRAAAAEANGCGEAYRALAGSHLSRDERLFAAYYSTMRAQFASLARIGSNTAAQASAGLVRAAIPVARPLVVASADGVAQAMQSLARTASRALTRPLERLNRQALWVPPRVQIPRYSLETSITGLLSRRLDNIGRLIAANRQPLRGGLLAFETLRALSRYSERYSEPQRLGEIRQKLDAWSEGPLAYITEPLRPGVVIEVIGLVEETGEMALLDLLERAVRDEQVMARLRTTINALPLSESKRARLDHALGHVLSGEFLLAIDALIAVVEGLFWEVAIERGLIARKDRFTPASGLAGKARGLEQLLGPLGVPAVFHAFLVQRAYGGQGHPYRHGRAEEGEREQVLLIIVALAGWLEIFAGVPARGWLLGALEREISTGTLAGAALSALDTSATGKELL